MRNLGDGVRISIGPRAALDEPGEPVAEHPRLARAGARERQKQIELARQRNQPHPLGRDPRQSTLEN